MHYCISHRVCIHRGPEKNKGHTLDSCRGSVATRLRCGGICNGLYCKYPRGCANKRVFKMILYLSSSSSLFNFLKQLLITIHIKTVNQTTRLLKEVLACP